MKIFDEFLKNYHAKRFSKGELILVQGEVPTCAYVIKSGVIKTYNLTSAGEEKPITFDVAYEIFPIGWVFGQIHHAQYFYEAFSEVEVYCVPRQEYMNFLKASQEFTFEAYTNLVGRYLNYQMRVNALEQSKAALKILNTLHFLCLRFGKEVKPHTVRIELLLTHQELANFMGLTRETTGTEIKKLERSGILTYRKQMYTVNTDKLNELLDEEYELGFVHEYLEGQPRP